MAPPRKDRQVCLSECPIRPSLICPSSRAYSDRVKSAPPSEREKPLETSNRLLGTGPARDLMVKNLQLALKSSPEVKGDLPKLILWPGLKDPARLPLDDEELSKYCFRMRTFIFEVSDTIKHLRNELQYVVFEAARHLQPHNHALGQHLLHLWIRADTVWNEMRCLAWTLGDIWEWTSHGVHQDRFRARYELLRLTGEGALMTDVIHGLDVLSNLFERHQNFRLLDQHEPASLINNVLLALDFPSRKILSTTLVRPPPCLRAYTKHMKNFTIAHHVRRIAASGDIYLQEHGKAILPLQLHETGIRSLCVIFDEWWQKFSNRLYHTDFTLRQSFIPLKDVRVDLGVRMILEYRNSIAAYSRVIGDVLDLKRDRDSQDPNFLPSRAVFPPKMLEIPGPTTPEHGNYDQFAGWLKDELLGWYKRAICAVDQAIDHITSRNWKQPLQIQGVAPPSGGLSYVKRLREAERERHQLEKTRRGWEDGWQRPDKRERAERKQRAFEREFRRSETPLEREIREFETPRIRRQSSTPKRKQRSSSFTK